MLSIRDRPVRLHAEAGALAGQEGWCMVKYLFLVAGLVILDTVSGDPRPARRRAGNRLAAGPRRMAGWGP